MEMNVFIRNEQINLAGRCNLVCMWCTRLRYGGFTSSTSSKAGTEAQCKSNRISRYDLLQFSSIQSTDETQPNKRFNIQINLIWMRHHHTFIILCSIGSLKLQYFGINLKIEDINMNEKKKLYKN